ncbi:MAG: hypothetical protein HQ512_12790 [Rhodospirillales bacterium]|nr:hypothetical protein [Rhodospirillales bacterium]
MRLIVLFILLPVLTACQGAVIVRAPIPNLNYIVDDFDYASRNGEIRTRVGDDPFGGPHAEFSAKVTKLMYGANVGGDVVFTSSPQGKGSGRHHVVMLFNPPISADEEDFCGPKVQIPTLPLTNALRLVSTFCYEDQMLSTADGQVSGVRSPQSPLFRKLVRQVTLALFPPVDHLDVSGEGDNSTN